MVSYILMSNMKFVFVVWLFALLLSSMMEPSQQTPHTIKIKFHFIKAYCKINKCTEEPPFPLGVKEISMTEELDHRSELTDGEIAAYKVDLEWYWPVLTAKDFEESKKYWKDLYKKHGASRTKEFSPEEYIVFGSKKFNQYVGKLWLALSGYGTSPEDDPEKFKTPTQIVQAMREAIKHKPDIVCALYNGHYFLLEVHVCFNDKTNAVDCFEGKENYCPETDVVHYVEK